MSTEVEIKNVSQGGKHHEKVWGIIWKDSEWGTQGS
jgi:hypothetical protein